MRDGMEISKELSAYIEYEFIRMLKESIDLEKKREDFREGTSDQQSQPTTNKQRIREREKHLKNLSGICAYIDMDNNTDRA